eukprot:9093231-Alexandrium_andersonii.AAC.1
MLAFNKPLSATEVLELTQRAAKLLLQRCVDAVGASPRRVDARICCAHAVVGKELGNMLKGSDSTTIFTVMQGIQIVVRPSKAILQILGVPAVAPLSNALWS